MNKSVLFSFFIIAIFLPASPVLGAETGVRLFMPDGQLNSYPVRVFVSNKDIDPSMKPRLRLAAGHVLLEKKDGESSYYEPEVVAPGQRLVQNVHGQRIAFTGTVLFFDLSKYPFPFYKAALRITPILEWREKSGQKEIPRIVVGPDKINLGNIIGASLWTLLLVATLITCIVAWSRQVKGKAAYLLCNVQGNLSLSRTQVAAWTIVIGGMVTGFGLIKFELPDIPETLVAMMGLSLVTGGMSYVQAEKKNPPPAGAAPVVKTPATVQVRKYTPHWSDLLCDSPGKLSLPKAQMVFWTGIVLVLFVAKSILNGDLWEIPWEMVAFMGMSQAGYLAPKFKSAPNPNGAGPDPAAGEIG
ncbi:MAG: hypothetical protein GXP57_02480 [Deltaproteobacteria bacterium]|nr:hypothetical protein [Deltaproteobacteria bacterium]